MINVNYFISILVLIGMLTVYNKILKQDEQKCQLKKYKQYLIEYNSSETVDLDKPILWIHVEHEKNSRWWQSFYSRNSEYLNQPYVFLTIKSIIKNNYKDFNICMIDDDSFNYIIPGWNHNIALMANPIKCHIRQLALAKMLSIYGGLLVPKTFVCTKSLITMYNSGLNNKNMFMCENIPKSILASKMYYYPNTNFIGCKAKCDEIIELTDFIATNISKNFTDELKFSGTIDKFCYDMALNNKVDIICGSKIGVKDINNKQIQIEELFEANEIKLSQGHFGLYIPETEILNRVKYNYFPRMSVNQVLESNTFLCNYIRYSTMQ